MVTTRGARREPPCTDCVRKFDSKENRRRNIWVFCAFLQGTGWSKKKRTPGPIFGSPAAGTPVRRGGALVRRPATAGPPGATPKLISACFIGQAVSLQITSGLLRLKLG